MIAMKVSAPFLVAGLVVGLLVSIFQAATQIQEQTLSFIPKIVVTGVVIAVGGPWMLDQLVGYTQALFLSIPRSSRSSAAGAQLPDGLQLPELAGTQVRHVRARAGARRAALPARAGLLVAAS